MPKKAVEKIFKQVMADIGTLDDASKRKVLAYLKRHISSDGLTVEGFIKDLRDKRFRNGFACPHCNSEKVVRNGTHRGRQDYKCKTCSKHFSDQTHTPFRGTHYPEKWLPFMEHMINGLSIRKSAKILCVADLTVFTWRHKILTAMMRMEMDGFEGLLEVDETYFLYSEKGNKKIVGRKPRKRGGSSKFRGISREQVCVVVARDRTKQTLVKVACMGQVSKVTAEVILKSYVGSVSSVCSDANSTWRGFAGDSGISHIELNASKRQRIIKNIYHIQNVNAFHSRLKKWMDRFKGVATKYLDNYLTWFRFIDSRSREAMSAKKLDLLITACLPISPERYMDIRSTKLVLP
jgi:transposase-like protein